MSTSVSGASKYFPTAQDGFSTTTTGTVLHTATTVPLTNTGSYTNGAVVVLVIDPGVTGKQATFTGVIDTSGIQVTGVVWTGGNTTADHTSGATVIDYVTATHLDLITTGIKVEHNDNGTHAAVTATSVTASGNINTSAGKVQEGGNSLIPAGVIQMYGASSAPSGWKLCDGSAISRTTYATLFGVIGTTYGTGDGSTTFNLPDFRGRSPLGSGTGTASGATAHSLGSQPTSGAGGEETHTLSVAEMPAHTHNVGTSNSSTPGASGNVVLNTFNNTVVSSSTGGGGAHNILSPVSVVNFIIKT